MRSSVEVSYVQRKYSPTLSILLIRYVWAGKLVRGAYMVSEREKAKEEGYESPVYEVSVLRVFILVLVVRFAKMLLQSLGSTTLLLCSLSKTESCHCVIIISISTPRVHEGWDCNQHTLHSSVRRIDA